MAAPLVPQFDGSTWSTAALASMATNVKDYGATGDGSHDDTAAITAAILAASTSTKIVFFPPGTYRVSSTIDPGNVSLVGAGTLKSVIQAAPTMVNSTVLYAPNSTAYLDRLTIDGWDHTANGNTGILAISTNNHDPYSAVWGSIDVVECATGVRGEQSASGLNIFYNNFGSIKIRDVIDGFVVQGDGTQITEANANYITFLSVSAFTGTALKVVSPAGWAIGFFHAETASLGGIGIDVQSCSSFIINGGYMEMGQASDKAIKLDPHYSKGFSWNGHIGIGTVVAATEDQQSNYIRQTIVSSAIATGSIPKFFGRIAMETIGFNDGSIQKTAAPNPTSLPSPTTLNNSVEVVGGGTLAAGTYYYRIASRNSFGVSLALAEHAVVVANANGAVKVDWDPVPGAVSYDIFGRTSGAELLLFNWVVGPGQYTQTSWIDTGALTPSGALPTRDSTSDYKLAGRLTANSLGVGNSAAATTPGSVVKKIQVFDAAGNSLGYVAVYDTIT